VVQCSPSHETGPRLPPPQHSRPPSRSLPEAPPEYARPKTHQAGCSSQKCPLTCLLEPCAHPLGVEGEVAAWPGESTGGNMPLGTLLNIQGEVAWTLSITAVPPCQHWRRSNEFRRWFLRMIFHFVMGRSTTVITGISGWSLQSRNDRILGNTRALHEKHLFKVSFL